jgi:hypothetical protein
MTPDHAAYGADVTITGTGFGDSPIVGVPGGGAAIMITSASDTEIHLRVQFPSAPCMFQIEGPGGSVVSPAFTPTTTWTPGPSLAKPETIVDAKLFGSVFAMIGVDSGATASLALFDGTTARSIPLAGVVGSNDRRHPTPARLVSDGAGGFVIVANIATKLEVIAITGGTATAVDTGITAPVIAADRDATGLYAWVQFYDSTNGEQVERVRPSATAGAPWVVERGPIASEYVLDAKTAADGTLVVAYGADASSFFDNMQTLAITRLAPSASAFAGEELPDAMPWDDYIASAQLTMAADGQRMIVGYSTQQNDEQTDHAAPPDLRDASGQWTYADLVASALAGGGSFAYTATALATIAPDDTGLVLVPDLTKPAATLSVPLWPANSAALVDDGTGALRPVITLDGKIWFPSPPAAM